MNQNKPFLFLSLVSQIDVISMESRLTDMPSQPVQQSRKFYSKELKKSSQDIRIPCYSFFGVYLK
jgi:hypothetical protein